jgi:hypothetical protein
MRHLLLLASLLAFALTAAAADPEYPRQVAQWQEVGIPSGTDQGARMAWFYAANYSDKKWRVFVEGGQVCAQLIITERPEQRVRPGFTPKIGHLSHASAFARIDDGWLSMAASNGLLRLPPRWLL